MFVIDVQCSVNAVTCEHFARRRRQLPAPLEDWNAAYVKVENYFHALRVRNKLLLGQLVQRVLDRAMRRAPAEPDRSATQLAAEEMDHLVTEWFAEVLQSPSAKADQTLSTRGRLALLLADMPGKWQEQFLRPGPWPEEFTTAMREAFLRAGPDFQLSKMTPRPLDLGPIATLTSLGRCPISAWRWRGRCSRCCSSPFSGSPTGDLNS